jgi:hypothetical protein
LVFGPSADTETTGVIESGAGRVESEDDDFTGLLVVSIILMIAVVGLFGYLMYKEKGRKEKDPVGEHGRTGI